MLKAFTQASWFGFNLQDCFNHVGLVAFNDVLMWSQLGIGLLVLLSILMIYYNSYYYSSIMEWHTLEVIWTLAPGLVLVGLGVPSLSLLYELESGLVRPDLTLKIVGSQWFWSYELLEYGIVFDAYSETDRLFSQAEGSSRLVLPLGGSVLALVTSTDVIHRWALPSLGVKADCNPGRLNRLWLFSAQPGLILRNCFELCGAFHSSIPISVEFTLPALFIQWCSSISFQARLY